MTSKLEIREKLMARRAWESRGNADSIWDKTTCCIRKIPRKVLGVSRGHLGKYQVDWW